MSKPKIGDVIEIPTSQGLAYAQYTHQHPRMGGLIRVFDRVFRDRPRSFDDLVRGPVRFCTFFPVTAAVKRGIFEIVSQQEVATQNKPFPLFRGGNPDPNTKRVAVWWFWDGEKERKVGEITPEQRKMPLREIWNDTMLVKRIEAGWTPQNDPS